MAIEHFEKRNKLDSSLVDLMLTTADFDPEKKEIVSFCVVQLFSDGAFTRQIIKYDSAHGNCHVHRYYRASDSKELIFNKGVSAETFRWCRNDVMENWRKYKTWFIERRPL